MKTSGKIITAAVLAAFALLGVMVVIGHQSRQRLVEQNLQLQERLEELTMEEKRSAVMQRVNAQMEEIANEERRISDEQREEAIEQKMVADEMRRNAEAERQNALVAEQHALEASEVAQSQRRIAEQQRSEAEQSKRVADTLTYISLARTLGQAAITQFKAGNNEIADLLTQTACLFTTRYHGDIYYPTVYQALATASQNETVWNKHKGSITDIAFSGNKSAYMVTCSTYGEIIKHTQYAGNQLTSETLVSNPRYDFRDIFIDRTTNVIYALSRSGHLIVIDPDKKVHVVIVNIQNLKELDTTGRQFIIFGEEGMALLDTEKLAIVEEKKLPFQIECASRSDNYPIIFDRQGRMHIVKSFSNIVTSPVPFKGQVTSYTESKDLTAFGMSDGSINIINSKGQKTRLVGHLSRISKVKADGYRLYSSSYDGTLNLWLTNSAKIAPMPLFTTKGWIINFTFDLQMHFVWSGDQKGNLTRALISVPEMQKRLQTKLKRNMTHEEWNYYIGRNVPYEKVMK